MNCRAVRLNIVPLIEGELPAAEARALEGHLAGCASCLEDRARLEPAVRVLLGARVGAAINLGGFIEGVHARAAAARPRRRRWRWALAGAAAIVITCLLIWLQMAQRPARSPRLARPPAGVAPHRIAPRVPGVGAPGERKPGPGEGIRAPKEPGRAPAPGPPQVAIAPAPGKALPGTRLREGDAGMIAQVFGAPRIRKAGVWRTAAQYDTFRVGDELSTGASQALGIWFTDGTRMQIAPKSQVAVRPPQGTGRRPALVRLERGDVSVAVAKAQSRFAVSTPAATATATGTRFGLDVAESGETALAVFSGSVVFSNSAGTVTAAGAVRTTATANSAPTAPVGIGMGELLAGAPGRLRDSFDAPPLNEAVWILENINKGVLIAQQDGRVTIQGVPMRNFPGYRPQLLTYFFPRQDFTAEVNFRLGPDAQDGATLGVGGAHAAFGDGVAFDPEQGYRLFDQGYLPPFGDERQAFHRLRLTYEAATSMLTGYVDDTEVGSVEVLAPNFFLGFGATSGKAGTRIHVEFDDFEATFGGGRPLPIAVPPVGPAMAEQAPGVVLDVGPPDAWDGLTVYNPSVLKRDNRYEMWYAADPPQGSWMGSSVGLAYSDDGINWSKHEGNPVLTDGGAPCVLYRDWGDGYGPYYKMWYRHYEPSSRGSDVPITTLAYATSEDGVHWTKHGVIAGLRKEEGFGFRITSPSVVYLPEARGLPAPYLMYYYAEHHDVRMATSPDGVHWKPAGVVLKPSALPGWDSYMAEDAHVIYAGGRLHMFYAGNSPDPRYGSAIGYAVSEDGVNWRRGEWLAVAGSNVPNTFDFGLVQPMPLLDGEAVKIWTVCGPYSGLFGFWGKNIGFAEMPADALAR